ncbi:MAG: gamma carbonic anhydrase family protein [Sodalis sp. (in: enterobacteria)]
MTHNRSDDAVCFSSHQVDADADCWIAPGAVVAGQVRLAADASVWFHAVIRGDNDRIDIGPQSNIQEGAVLHADPGAPLTLGRGVTVGHQAMLHGCTIGDYSLIGINAVILNGAKIGRHCLIGANTLITEGKVIPDHCVVFGSPARVIREVSEAQRLEMIATCANYVRRAREYRTQLREQR